MSRQDREARRAAREFWGGLTNAMKWELGDALVLGDVCWADFNMMKPSAAFRRELDYQRILWEQSQ